MRRVLHIALLAGIVAAAGCNSRRGMPLSTKSYAGVEQGSLFAFAWGGAPGFEDSDAHDIVVLFDAEPADGKHRLTTCNPKESDCKALTDFSDTGLEPQLDASSLFGRFDTGVDKEDRLYLVVADRGPRLVTSDVIVAAAGSRPTRFSANELRFDRGTQTVAWPKLSDGDLYVLTMTGPSDEALTAITTRRRSWVYPELQGIAQYVHDPSQVPELKPGRRYVATLYAINKQSWATAVSSAVIKP